MDFSFTSVASAEVKQILPSVKLEVTRSDLASLVRSAEAGDNWVDGGSCEDTWADPARVPDVDQLQIITAVFVNY